MDRKLAKYLSDVHSSILEIESFMEERPREFATFCNDILFRRGVERNIEIMGEAMNQALKIEPITSTKITGANRVTGRNATVIGQ